MPGPDRQFTAPLADEELEFFAGLALDLRNNDLPVSAEAIRILISEVQRLQAAIQEHRDQRGDDRCWLDDLKLYAALPGESQVDGALPPRAEFLASCERYWRQRQPEGGCSPGRTIAQLEAENARAELWRSQALDWEKRCQAAEASLRSIVEFEPSPSHPDGPYEQIAVFAKKVARETLATGLEVPR